MDHKEINGFIVAISYLAFVIYLLFSVNMSFYLNRTLSLLAILSSLLIFIMAIASFRGNKIKVSGISLIILIAPLVFGILSNPANIETNSYQPIKATNVQITSTSPNTIDEAQIIADNANVYHEQNKDEESSNSTNPADYGIIIITNSSNFLNQVYQISKDPDKYEGRSIQIEGKLFQDKIGDKDYIFIGRYWIWHCFLDARIVGFDLIYDKNLEINETGWYSVEGTITHSVSDGSNITFVKVTNLEEIESKEKPYVY